MGNEWINAGHLEMKTVLKDERLLVCKHRQAYRFILPLDACASWLG
jgi:hypothetical protein